MEGSSPTPPQQPPVPQAPPGGAPAGQPPVQQAGAGGMAIAALILALVAIPLYVCCGIGVVPAVVSFILAMVERGNIEKGRSSPKGAGMIKASIIIDIIFFALFLVGLILYIVALAKGWVEPDGNYYYKSY